MTGTVPAHEIAPADEMAGTIITINIRKNTARMQVGWEHFKLHKDIKNLETA